MGFDQILRGEVVVVVKLQRFENEKRPRIEFFELL